jgi:hypothetical protein
MGKGGKQGQLRPDKKSLQKNLAKTGKGLLYLPNIHPVRAG